MDQELRFAFGKNWEKYLDGISEAAAIESINRLKAMLGRDSLEGLTFLDIGSGSGLSSLAACKLDASEVYSFDIDPESVRCTERLREQCGISDERWKVAEGSALDEGFLGRLGKFDIVYSWGVLHHTGDMWRAVGNAERLVAPSGYLYLALYNDQGYRSHVWRFTKWTYNVVPTCLRPFVFWPAFLRLWGPTTVKDLLKGAPFRTWRSYVQNRGMAPMIDAIDWVGGYPFEVASAARVTAVLEGMGYETVNITTVGNGRGCNEFVFEKSTCQS